MRNAECGNSGSESNPPSAIRHLVFAIDAGRGQVLNTCNNRHNPHRMRLPRVLSTIGMHSWTDHAVQLINSAAGVTGVVAAALLLISLGFLYFTRTELAVRTNGTHSLPAEAERKFWFYKTEAGPKGAAASTDGNTSRIAKLEKQLAAARDSEKAKAVQIAKLDTELAASRRSGEAMVSRTTTLETALAAARESEKTKATRVTELEKELAASRQSEKAHTRRITELEGGLATARESDKAKAARVTEIEAELTAVKQSEKASVERTTKLETELAAAQRSDEAKEARVAELEAKLAETQRSESAKALRVVELEGELGTAQHSAEEAQAVAKELEAKHGARKITSEQRDAFVKAVNGQPTGKIIVSAFFENKETHGFGAEIQELLRGSGFEVIGNNPLNFFTTSRPSSGVRIGCADMGAAPPHFFTVQKGFQAMGLETPISNLVNSSESDVVEIQLTPR